jgi:hypothetical protein
LGKRFRRRADHGQIGGGGGGGFFSFLGERGDLVFDLSPSFFKRNMLLDEVVVEGRKVFSGCL